MPPVRLLIIGAGLRGNVYAKYAESFPEQPRVVGVADPREPARTSMADTHQLPRERQFKDWREAAAQERFADAVVIATIDRHHTDPAVAFAERGYAMLLEKPMAQTEEECETIVRAVKRNGILFAVCHVMRYTESTRRLKSLIEAGVIGDAVCMQHFEAVGYWHQAHGFVRGKVSREEDATFMLMSKACHDLDWIRHLIGTPCTHVSSFGNLHHFRREQKPAEAGDAKRCQECAHEPQCPYSIRKIYLEGRKQNGGDWWPLKHITLDRSRKGVETALQEGPYGRCVYECDNDVVDHQVVNLQFAGGRTASFAMTAFTEKGKVYTRIFGTRGELRWDGLAIEHYDFLTDATQVIDCTPQTKVLSGHGGGDFGLMQAFVQAVAGNNPSKILTGPDETLDTHRIVFAAERSRRVSQVIAL